MLGADHTECVLSIYLPMMILMLWLCTIIFCALLYHDNLYLGLGSYRLTIIERNDGVGCKVSGIVVKKSFSCVSNMNSECFSDCESYLLECVDRWCWSRVYVRRSVVSV